MRKRRLLWVLLVGWFYPILIDDFKHAIIYLNPLFEWLLVTETHQSVIYTTWWDNAKSLKIVIDNQA